jgi:hypothetical protein
LLDFGHEADSTLPVVALVDQFWQLERGLSDDWEAARLRLTVPDDGDCARAAALLGPTNPGRRGKVINFLCARRGGGVGLDRIRDLLRRIDREGIEGTLELVDVRAGDEATTAAAGGLAIAWDEAVAALPDDWSDLYGELELPSTDYIEPAAVRLSPLNPRRTGRLAVFGFRAARRFGYGAAPEMARRCLERLDEAGITGELRIVNVFSDTEPVKTQGPVWSAGGRMV